MTWPLAETVMWLADAPVLYVAEKEQIENVFALDRRDFNLFTFAGTGR